MEESDGQNEKILKEKQKKIKRQKGTFPHKKGC